MKDEVTQQVQRELFLKQFSPTPPPAEVTRTLSRAMRDVFVRAGETIFEKGEAARSLYFIVEGEVELLDELATLPFGKGAMIGVVDANIERPHLRKAVAKTDVHLLAFEYREWLEVLEDNPEYTSAARRKVADMLHGDMLLAAPSGGFGPPNPSQASDSNASTVLMRLLALREIPAFSSASVQALTELAERSHTRRLRRGELVYGPGGGVGSIVVVMWGELAVERRLAPVVTARFGRRQIVLGCAAFGSEIAGYAVTAISDSLIMSLGFEDIDDVAEDHFDLVRSFLRALTIERERLVIERARRQSNAPRSRQSLIKAL